MKNPLRFVAIVLVAVTCVYIFAGDYIEVWRVKAESEWIEDFYTSEGYYPTVSDFQQRFPLTGILTASQYYSSGDAPKHFELSYRLLFGRERSFALGGFSSDLWGGGGEYNIKQCARWSIENRNLAAPWSIYEYIEGTFIDGVLVSDVKKGTISFHYGGNSAPDYMYGKNVEIITGLVKPRILKTGNFEYVYISDADSVYKYHISHKGNEIILTRGEKIGNVPTGCPKGPITEFEYQ
ncbi:MAG: hypothetical protein Q7R90_01770 [bacterium]|nr:hypothetical protein [bacterium]